MDADNARLVKIAADETINGDSRKLDAILTRDPGDDYAEWERAAINAMLMARGVEIDGIPWQAYQDVIALLDRQIRLAVAARTSSPQVSPARVLDASVQSFKGIYQAIVDRVNRASRADADYWRSYDGAPGNDGCFLG